jgi:murein L,D-transpeptidase YcbB/YkuD
MNKPQILRFTIAAGIVLAAAGAGINLSTSHRGQPGKEPPLRLVLNVPAHKIFVFEKGELTKQIRVGVGMPGNETPAGSYRLTQAIWNPWWNPPSSDWAKGRKAEAPGPTNPMGRVKMNFAPLLYIHGTAYRGGVGDPSSHGCVHVMNDDLIELARIVHKYATPALDTKVLDELAASPQETRQINFRNSIPFDVVYNVATVQNNYLYLYPDVYDQIPEKAYIAQVKDVLAEHGIQPHEVDETRIAELMEQAKTTRAVISLDTLRVASASASASPNAKPAPRSGTKQKSGADSRTH